MYTNEFLFYEKDWSIFYKKITSLDYEIINEEFKSKMDSHIFLIDIIKYILNRNPQKRPSIHNILKRLKAVFKLLNVDINQFQKHTKQH